ncbi:MAG: hepatic lectin [Planctomycetaceae bacterium]|nr:hepatic lectin [Planctomycetaceae bacterium]
MSQNLLAVAVIFGSVAFAADLSEKWQKRLESADGLYQAAKMKADNARFYALQKANSDRLKLLKTALADATKSGDFDAATAIKERITVAEKTGIVRTKPKNLIKFGGHEFALIEEKATWHVAKRRCEEMEGHLACLKSESAVAFGFMLYQKYGDTVWIGATDEEQEGEWVWVDGTRLSGTAFDERKQGAANHLAFAEGKLLDGQAGSKCAYLCQWDN